MWCRPELQAVMVVALAWIMDASVQHQQEGAESLGGGWSLRAAAEEDEATPLGGGWGQRTAVEDEATPLGGGNSQRTAPVEEATPLGDGRSPRAAEEEGRHAPESRISSLTALLTPTSVVIFAISSILIFVIVSTLAQNQDADRRDTPSDLQLDRQLPSIVFTDY